MKTIALLGCTIIIGLCAITLGGCWVLDMLSGPKADALLLDESAFRLGTVTTPRGPFALRGAEEIVGRSFSLQGQEYASQMVLRFQNERGAEIKFTDLRHTEFRDDLYNNARWLVPSELPYRSPVAAQFYLACLRTEDDSTPSCQAIGRYSKYVTLFSAKLHSDLMTFADLERVLRAIDERMARVLGKPLPPPATSP